MHSLMFQCLFVSICPSWLMLAEAVHVTGSLTRNVQTSRQSTPSMIDTHQTGLQTAKYTMDAPKHTKANVIAPIFTFCDGSARFSCHSRRMGPNSFDLVSHDRNWSDDRAKQNADRRMKGVVGRPGRIIPAAPAARERRPIVSHAARRRMGRCLLSPSRTSDSVLEFACVASRSSAVLPSGKATRFPWIFAPRDAPAMEHPSSSSFTSRTSRQAVTGSCSLPSPAPTELADMDTVEALAHCSNPTVSR
jgi:hypothetical protein